MKKLTKLTADSSRSERLDVAFAAMRKQGLLARQRFSCCMGCATYALAGMFKQPRYAAKIGAVYYHKQDAANLDQGIRFYLGFGSKPSEDPAQEAAQCLAVGKMAAAALRDAGLIVSWPEDPNERICVEPSPGQHAWTVPARLIALS